MPPVGFKPKISAGERPQTYALGRAATGTGSVVFLTGKSEYKYHTQPEKFSVHVGCALTRKYVGPSLIRLIQGHVNFQHSHPNKNYFLTFATLYFILYLLF
jgi:hypothetical protein